VYLGPPRDAAQRYIPSGAPASSVTDGSRPAAGGRCCCSGCAASRSRPGRWPPSPWPGSPGRWSGAPCRPWPPRWPPGPCSTWLRWWRCASTTWPRSPGTAATSRSACGCSGRGLPQAACRRTATSRWAGSGRSSWSRAAGYWRSRWSAGGHRLAGPAERM